MRPWWRWGRGGGNGRLHTHRRRRVANEPARRDRPLNVPLLLFCRRARVSRRRGCAKYLGIVLITKQARSCRACSRWSTSRLLLLLRCARPAGGLRCGLRAKDWGCCPRTSSPWCGGLAEQVSIVCIPKQAAGGSRGGVGWAPRVLGGSSSCSTAKQTPIIVSKETRPRAPPLAWPRSLPVAKQARITLIRIIPKQIACRGCPALGGACGCGCWFLAHSKRRVCATLTVLAKQHRSR